MTVVAKPISVLGTLSLLEVEFSAFSKAFISGEFSVWMGSGISRNPPDLGELISRAIEHLRNKYNEENGEGPFSSAFTQALGYTGLNLEDLEVNFDKELASWPQHGTIINELWNRYSDLLNIIIAGEDPDYMLWNAVDVRQAFDGRQNPGSEHLCLAIFVLEGAITKLASANWDACLENAIKQLASSTDNILQVVVNPNQLRDPPCPARLIKFHGCIAHATEKPEDYRSFLTATQIDILQYADRPEIKAIHDQLINFASETKTLTAGLSLQDTNLQQVFSKARVTLKWEWPCDVPVLVFCEEHDLKDGQKNALRITYGDKDFASHQGDILKNAHLASWPQKVFIAMVLKLLLDKLLILADHSLREKPIYSNFATLVNGLRQLQSFIAISAKGDLDGFTEIAISSWSRLICIFRNGKLPLNSQIYHGISNSSLPNLITDGNAVSAGFGELALGLSLIGAGVSEKIWKIDMPKSEVLSAGAFSCLGAWDGAQDTSVFFVSSVSSALELQKQGALEEKNTVVIHSDDSWSQLSHPAPRKSSRSPGRSVGRDGNYGARHVSLKELVNTTDQYEPLKTKFIEAVTI